MKCKCGYLAIKNKISKLIKKNNFKVLSVLLIISLIITNISFHNVRTMATTPDKPGFTISDISFDPSEPKVGEDITVTGRITPADFEIPVPSKEIVLVLDVSGSMKDEVTVECTNPRVDYKVSDSNVYYSYGKTYTKINNIKFEVTKINGYYYIKDYCSEHNKVGEHNSTKISELKRAANNFVDKMKNVSNLKIGIVTYASIANIRRAKINNDDVALIPASNDQQLKEIINGLEANGGTNTGEGLRKAAYLLANSDGEDSTANKTVVLMSDGLPSFHSVKNDNSDYEKYYYYKSTTGENWGYGRKSSLPNNYSDKYYVDITKEYDTHLVTNSGDGSNDTSDFKDLEYAKTISGLIEDKDYNVFSIGYGLNDSGNEKLSQIHEAMGGTLPGNNQDVEKTYFETDNGAIDTVFQNIATQIINNYDIKGGILTSKMLNPFGLALGGETVSIPDIHYKKDEANSTSTKIRYHAEPYTFTFKIKASKAGDYSNIFNDSYISFPWNNEIISCKMPYCNLKISDNKLPNIEANLKERSQTVNLGQDVTVTYGIKANSFQYKDDANQLLPKDVVILFDTSSGMKDKIGQFINGAFNDLLNNTELKSAHTKYSIITFNTVATICDPSKYQNFRPDSNYDTANLKTDTTAINDYVVKNLTYSQSTDRKIGLALQKADNVLSEDTGKVNKYILLISSGSVTYTESDIEALKGKGYIIISLAIGTQNSGQNPQTFLYDIHKSLAGESSASSEASGGNYFISPGAENNNDIANYIMKNIAKKIIGLGDRKSYIFDDVYLNFEMGENFKEISGLNSIGTNKYRVKVPRIVYNYNQNTSEYTAETVNDISFKFKAGGTNLLFGDLHTITYTGINETIDKNISVPIITVRSGELKHGIYKGILEDTKIPNIDDTQRTFAKGATVTFGAYVDGAVNNTPITLKFDYGINSNTRPNIDLSKIKIYKIIDGALINLNYSGQIENGIYTYTPSGLPETGGKVLILYTEVLSKDALTGTKYTNVLNVPGIPEKNAVLTVGENLPDLF